MNAVETAAYLRQQKISEIQACSNHLKATPQSDRPESATLTEVQTATVTAHENLNATDIKVAEISRVECPCMLLDADRCHRDDSQDLGPSQ
jgi:hypothetical protein